MAKVEEMKKIIIILLCVLLVIPLVTAHSIETKFVIRSDGQYNIKFSTDPEFPIVNKETHLDFEIWDNQGEFISISDIKIILVKDDERQTLALIESHEHYEIKHIFEEPGVYKIIPSINGQELDLEFSIEIDSFGRSGMLRGGLIILLLLVLIIFMYKDCKKARRKIK